MGNKQKQSLLDVSMELKMTGRGLERQSVKLENSEKNEMKKIKDVSAVDLTLVLALLQSQKKYMTTYHIFHFVMCRLLTRIRWRTRRSSPRT